MIRIIHLSDIHLNDLNLRDWNNYVKEALFKKLNELKKEKQIDLILCTGDNIDKGGRDFKNAKEAFSTFKSEIIDSIIQEINIPINQFLIIPGNHDIERLKDNEIIEKGLTEHLKTHENISKFIVNAINKNDFFGIERIKAFKEFEENLFKGNNMNQKLTIFGSSFKYKFNEDFVGICCLNSAWRCYTKNEIDHLLIGEDQLINNFKFISDCSIKICLMHHPLDWLMQIEKGIITKHINKDFDILLMGHTHESLTSMSIGFQRSLFINISPSGLNDIRSDSRSLANGLTVIDYDKQNKKISCEYLRYNHLEKSFVLNTDIENEGRFVEKIPDKGYSKNEGIITKALTTIKEDRFPEMDNHLIMHKVDKLKNISIKDAFVLPPIRLANSQDEEEQILSISDITKDKSNIIFFGDQESGKTILLYRIIREFVDCYDLIGKIPAYFDFELQGNSDIETLIKEYLKCSSREIEYLIKEGLLVVIIDNLNYSESKIDQIKKLHKFLGKPENNGIRILATAENENTGVIPTEYFKLCTIPFKNYLINGLKSKEIKKIMKFWLPEDDELTSEDKLEKMVTNFCSYSLPSTAMSVSLYLWSLENPDRPPINHAVLLEIYIELLLQKLTIENIYRDRFDFTNKIQLIARIAEKMMHSKEENCCILMSDYFKTIEEYLDKLVGFDFIIPRKIADYLIERKIFTIYKGNKIKFSYSCYYHFFLAKRMEYNPEFRKYILDEERYHNFFREIDFYTALVRSDIDTFNLISKRFIEKFLPTEFILSKLNIDDYFIPISNTDRYKAEVSNANINKIKEKRPSSEIFEKYYDNRLLSINDPSKIINLEGKITLDRLLLIMSNVLRNSEGIESRELKNKMYNALIKYNIIFMILYKESIIRYVKENKKLPPSIPTDISFDFLLKNIPLFVQSALNRHLGNPKLSSIILDKIKMDKKNLSFTHSDIESFLSVALYSDIQGHDFPRHLKSFIKRLRNNPTIDYLFYKIIDYYYRRTRQGSPNEEMYLDLLSDLRIKSLKYPKRIKETIIKKLQEGKKRFLETNEKF